MWNGILKRGWLAGVMVVLCSGVARAEEGQAAKWWKEMEGEEPAASRAMLALTGRPAEAIALFKERVLPLKISAEEVRGLIKDLGSDDDAVWKGAFEKMEYFDPRLAIPLKEVFDGTIDVTARERLVDVLSDVKAGTYAGRTVKLSTMEEGWANFFEEGKGSWGAEPQVSKLAERMPKATWTRAARAEILLGAIGTAEAVELLKGMASGREEALPTRVAKEELERLGTGN